LGEGVLQYAVYEMQKLLVLSATYLTKEENKSLIKSLSGLQSRSICSIFIESGIDPKLDISIEEQDPRPLPDRAELDNIVFDALKLSENERKDVYRAVCRLVWNRINKANSV